MSVPWYASLVHSLRGQKATRNSLERARPSSDLREAIVRWGGQIYDRHQAIAEREDRSRTERVLDNQLRLLVVLTGILAAGLIALPWLGAASVIGALVLLYAGTGISTILCLRQIRHIEAEAARRSKVAERLEHCLATTPELTPDDQALLIRISNLASGLSLPRFRAALRQELLEAAKSPRLSGWPLIHDTLALIDHQQLPVVLESAPAVG